MPKPDPPRDPYNPSVYSRSGQKARDEAAAAKTSERVKATEDAEYRTSAEGLGALAPDRAPKAEKTPRPDSKDFPGDLGGYSAAMRKWRAEQEEDSDNIAQKKAIRQMAK